MPPDSSELPIPHASAAAGTATQPPLLPRRARIWLPAVFFIGGFVWDALTLGRTIHPVDLWILLGYLAGAAVILVLIGRAAQFPGARFLGMILQFFFGGIFSALFIFYFLSSSDLPGYLVVALLAALLVGNEFLESAYQRLTLSWVLFALSATMFFNFAFAHLFQSISTFWFYLGTAVAVALVLALRAAAGQQTATILPALAVTGGLAILHIVNVIPPVPLVKKEMLIAHDLRKSNGAYLLEIEPPGVRFWRSSSPTYHRRAGERIYCFTSVFVPRGIETTIRHRWQRFDETAGGWVDGGVIPFRIRGGREGGYRGYTFKTNPAPGRWRVLAEAESGATIGVIRFEVVDGEARSLERRRL